MRVRFFGYTHMHTRRRYVFSRVTHDNAHDTPPGGVDERSMIPLLVDCNTLTPQVQGAVSGDNATVLSCIHCLGGES